MAANPDLTRVLLEIEHEIRALNRDIINPKIPELTVDAMCPVMELVARARGNYLESMFALADRYPDGLPAAQDIAELHKLRVTFEELVAGAQALQAAIERGYLDVKRKA